MEQPIYFPENTPDYQENQENTQLRNQNINLSNALNSSFSGSGFINENLIQYQLEADKFKEDIRHYISGDEITQDSQGNIFYEKQKNPDLRTLNDFGVSEFMRIISGYITKETFLSVYGEERINEIIGTLGQELRKTIYSNCALVGMDTEYKQSKFILLVFNVLTYVESAYRRSIGGKEREGLREGRIITQNQSLQMPGQGLPSSIMPKKKFNLLDKSSW